MKTASRLVALLVCLGWIEHSSVEAQLIRQQVDNVGWQSGFSESFGLQWGLRGPNFQFQTGGPPLIPPFGPPVVPSSIGLGGPGGSLRLFGGQSSSQSVVGTSASVTTMNGVPGMIQDQTLRPFVTGFTPVVGAANTPLASIAHAREQTLSRISEAAANAKLEKLQRYLRRAERGEEQENRRMALANYRLALGMAPPSIANQIRQRMAWLKQTSAAPD